MDAMELDNYHVENFDFDRPCWREACGTIQFYNDRADSSNKSR